jgi:peptide/nickel transport system permease protein
MLQQVTLPVRDSFWRRFSHDRGGLAALTLLTVLIAGSLGAGALDRTDPFRTSRQRLSAPVAAHPLGTDALGRDQLSRLLHGGRTSLEVGVSVAILATLTGLAVGGVAGYTGGWIDDLMMRVTEFFQVVPRFFAALVIVAVFGSRISIIILILGLTSWTVTARIVRAEVLSVRAREFVAGAIVVGAGGTRVLIRHVLPNVISPVIVVGSIQVGSAVLAEAGLAFLGVGDPRVVSWGSMLQESQRFMRSQPWLAVEPGMAVTVAVLAVNRIGDALTDALSSRGRGRRTGLSS